MESLLAKLVLCDLPDIGDPKSENSWACMVVKVENPNLLDVWLLRKMCMNVALYVQAHTLTCLCFLPLESDSRKEEVRSKNKHF